MKKFFPRICKNFVRILPFIFTLILSQISFSQEITVRLKITNSKNEPVPYASFTVVKRGDTTQVQKKAADSSGFAAFSLLRNTQYIVKVSSANYQPVEKGITVTSEHASFSFVAESFTKTMQEVVVTSKAPLMTQEDDKTIIDPEPIAAASTNAYEILEKTPGVFVDQDGNVYLSSMTPATIYINGREMKMSTADIATMLKNLPPNAISKIEILRTPSAKYDATSTGGIVNIILKKGVKLGMTGSITAGLQQGSYGNQFLSFNLNNNNGKKSSFINLNYSKRNSFEQIVTNRIFAPDSMLAQAAYTKYPGNSYFGGYGISNEWKKNWNIDFDGNISYNNFNNNTDNQSAIKTISNSDTLINNLNRVNNNGFTLNIRNGIDFTKKIDTTGSQWDNDIYYNYSQNNSNQAFLTMYYSPVLFSTGGDGTGDSKRDLFTAKSDLKLKMKRRFTLETGIKTSLLDFRNVANYFDETSGIRTKDKSRTNTFHYRENINAFYLQGSKTLWKDLIIKAGARLENTNMDGHQVIPADTSFKIHRTDIFPYIFLSKKVITIAGYELRSYLVYRRTITRPGYDQLNPFPRYVDQYLSETGNPALRPQFTTNYEANISVDERPLLAIGYNDTKDIFTNVIYQADSSNSVAYRTYDNLGTNKEIYLRGLGAIPPGKKYFFVLGAQFNHNFYQGFYENKPLSFEKDSWTFFTYHQLKLDKRSQFTLSGFVRFKGLQQFYELSTFGALNTSINRQFLKQKLIMTLSANDIFYTNQNDFTINQGSVNASGNRRADTRRFGINVRYNFGIRKKEENNDMFNVESPERSN
ncbi:MAG: TonB-dependent receptor domain-containing protein [Chitinophagales bacterium]